MSIVKVIEVIAQSEKSWEDAAQLALTEASETVRGIRSICIKDVQDLVSEDKIVSFRINAKISFLVEGD